MRVPDQRRGKVPHVPTGFRQFSTFVLILTLGSAMLIASLQNDVLACSFCILGESPAGGTGPNVYWHLADSVAACPAGDSVALGGVQGHHPSKLRVEVWYDDINCNPKSGVPPESLSITWATSSGNAAINDEGAQIYADDSTDACGHTRFTIPSLSGCGGISIALRVAGRSEGSRTAVIRTVDVDANGRADNGDLFQTTCDINYDGSTSDDGVVVAPHLLHWHRNALFGTLVRRSNYCETCSDGAANTRGEGQLSWSPGRRWIAYTAFVAYPPDTSCKVFIVPSDPKDGNVLTQLTGAPTKYHDYDPQWSPLNDVIVFDRGDSVIIKRTVPWVGTTETAITSSSNCGCGILHGDDLPAVSPDGQWVAFARCNVQRGCGGPGGWSIWKVPVGGGAARQLTPAAARADFYPSWSLDGQTIYFQREDATIGPQWTVWSVPADSGAATQVFIPSAADSNHIYDAVQPILSPDGQVLVMGYGLRSSVNRNVVASTLDPTISSPSSASVITNYNDPAFAEGTDFPILTPRFSPDGTRLALGSKQIWAARRNMSLPPRITQVGSQVVVDSTAVVSISAARALPTNVQVLATDPEGDPISCSAYFLRDGMTFDPNTCTLSWTPSLPVGTTAYVKFVVSTETWPHASGGADAIIAAFTVTSTAQPRSATLASSEQREFRVGPNPTRGAFSITAPKALGGTAKLLISDVTGRLVVVVDGRPGGQLVWDGRGRDGDSARPGVYLYRLEVGGQSREGKFVVVR